VADRAAAVRTQVVRQLAHWRAATVALDDPDNFAAPAAWRSLEDYLDLALRRELQAAVNRLIRHAEVVGRQVAAAITLPELESARRAVVGLRRQFVRVETVLDFYGDAVNTRTTPKLGALLRACDQIAYSAIATALAPFDRAVPPVLTYLDKGIGASVLRAGLRLWDPNSVSPAAAIKVTRRSLPCPTALIHEAGHQVAFTLGWNDELAAALSAASPRSPVLADMWAGWASEIAADTFAFAHCGYGAVAALHDVIAGEDDAVFRLTPGDPHPVGYLRVLLGVQMCRQGFGEGPWDDLAEAWQIAHPLSTRPEPVRRLITDSTLLLPAVTDACLARPMRCFGRRSLTALVNPGRVRPTALRDLAARTGPALYTSPHWLTTEGLRLLALSSFRAATEPDQALTITQQAEDWMLRLGATIRTAA
jgi:hypothetical protein